MSEILTAVRTAALLLTPLVILMIVASAVAIKREKKMSTAAITKPASYSPITPIFRNF